MCAHTLATPSALGGGRQWTVGRFDSVYGPDYWGRPVAYQEGPVGVIWRWGILSPGPQDSSTFDLPASYDVCSQACPIVIGEEAAAALRNSPEVRLAAAA
eukprot:CAMPEP_0113684094 /NCGR_PEP_ID=MMETSP0038_2-20120614/13762_1 /TAXON_ID=2898 /ORGANISM="Cryptomonas paramecium" /LENGTH=99 /DNA_ID=CAMNT_0000603705 /DNA_START=225 /DNA_END=521 /DNA_ORIENTATION=+ /assembly_acc=CAM_ASM_000170